MTLRELHERIAATTPASWRLLPAGPGFGGGVGLGGGSGTETDAPPATLLASDAGHLQRAVLRVDVDVVLTWGLRESARDYFEPWLGNLGRMTEVRCDRILLDVLWHGSTVDRRLGLAFADFVLPFPRSRAPRVKGLPDRFFDRDETALWSLVHELSFPDGVAFDRVVHRSGLRAE